MNDELRLRRLIRQQMSGGTPGSGYGTPGSRRDTTVLQTDPQIPKNTHFYKPPSCPIYTPVGTFTKIPLAAGSSNEIKEESDTSNDAGVKQSRQSITSSKSNKNSRKSSIEKNKLANSGHSSSYIDPDLLKRSQNQKATGKEDRKSIKKKNN